MRLRSIDFVEMQVKDWPSAVKWYQDKLSLEIGAREDEHEYCQLRLPSGSCKLALYGVPSVQLGTTNRCTPAILVDNLPATVAALREKAVVIKSDVTGGDEGYRVATIEDCEGNLIQLYEWYRPS